LNADDADFQTRINLKISVNPRYVVFALSAFQTTALVRCFSPDKTGAVR